MTLKVETNTAAHTLADEYLLSDSQIAAFQRDGHLILRGVSSPEEAAKYRTAILEGVRRHTAQVRPLAERDTYGKAFLQVANLWTEDETVREFVLARRFAKIAADLMGVEGVRIYHDQALFKEAGGGYTPWHQDQQYWPLDGVKTLTLWMPLVNAGESMGTLHLASGSQTAGDLGSLPISDASEAELTQYVIQQGFPVVRSGAMAAGDATFHSGWTLHGAPGNSSETTREVMTIIYFEDGARISAPDSASRESDLRGCFPGLAPGDLAASPINPLVYHR